MFAFKCVHCGGISHAFIYDDSGPCIYCGKDGPQQDVTTEVAATANRNTKDQKPVDQP